uniref:Uncharacterized protein n=1 Tax=Anguilla anguilla TaxID=7936 RepID=A0A0E9W2N0_ANGAN
MISATLVCTTFNDFD